MRKALETKLDLLEMYPAAVKQAIMEAQSDTEMVDVLGTVASVTRRVNEQRRLATPEVVPTSDEGELKGERHMVEVSRSATRSYNTAALMKTMQDGGMTLMDLIEMNVVNLSWRWTELKNFAHRRGMDLRMSKDSVLELGDIDGPHVGEVWKDSSPRWK